MRRLALAMMVALGASLASAQEAGLRLALPDSPQIEALARYMLPRFTLKHRVRVELVAEGADADLALREVAPGEPAYIQHSDGSVWALVGLGAGDDLDRLVDWLNSDVGKNTMLAFRIDDVAPFSPAKAPVVATVVALPEGDVDLGEELALRHCGRCHVVSDKNRYGGIGSTPSFGALRSIDGWQDKFAAFFTLNPHPSFTQVEGMTEPFHESRPPHIHPIHLTIEDVEAIAAFAARIKPKDLGAPVNSR